MDKLEAIRTFVRVVERGNFSAVARERNTTQPTISKQIQWLEQHLGGQLITRTTRQLSLTDEGQRYYRECASLLDSLDGAEHSFRTGQEAIAGKLRVAAAVGFGRTQITPYLTEFLTQHPDLELELLLSDRAEDLISEGIDVAFRIGELRDSQLVARRVGTTHRVTVASPAYIEAHGRPEKPEDLRQHNCIIYTLLASFNEWRYVRAGKHYDVSVRGNFSTNNSTAVQGAALAGLGIALSPAWLFGQDIAAGRVVRLLEEYVASSFPMHALFPPDRRSSARLKALLSFLESKWAIDPWAGSASAHQL